MVEQANELILDILPLSAQTARLVRVYGTAPCVTLPGTLPAPAGGSFFVSVPTRNAAARLCSGV